MILSASAVVSVLVLDYIGARRGERSYLFSFASALKEAAGKASPAAPAAGTRPYRLETPSERPGPERASGAAVKTFEEVLAASLAAAGVSDDSVLRLKGPKGRPLFEVEIPSELYESVGPAVEKALKSEGVRVLNKKRTPGEERTEVLWSLRRPTKQDAAISFVLPVEPPVAVAEKAPAAKKGPRGQVALIMDDMGSSLETLDELIALGRPITVSVLPYSAYAAETARLAHERGLEVLLHLPLESVNNHEAMAGTEGLIMAMMTEPAIVAAFEASYDRVPFADGHEQPHGLAVHRRARPDARPPEADQGQGPVLRRQSDDGQDRRPRGGPEDGHPVDPAGRLPRRRRGPRPHPGAPDRALPEGPQEGPGGRHLPPLPGDAGRPQVDLPPPRRLRPRGRPRLEARPINSGTGTRSPDLVSCPKVIGQLRNRRPGAIIRTRERRSP
ncbi:MAG: divergent polysaccharide deacetylase family protein [Desulfobacterales bacterium]|nr:divergent polysaccharide deacetylase family protein [Desulfobacterales bacterium]